MESFVLPVGFSDILFYVATTFAVLVLTRKVLRFVTRRLTQHRPESEGYQIYNERSKNAYLREASSRTLSQAVNSPLEKKRAMEQQFQSLSEAEKEEEFLVRQAQLSNIFNLMQSQPNRFGDISMEDMNSQFTQFYVRNNDT